MKRKKKSVLIFVFTFVFVALISMTIMTSRATFYKAGSRTILQSGNVTTYSIANWLIDNAPKSGTDNVTNSSWVLTSDHTGEWRYAGKNPDNYVSFNGELWRIIGIMPNTEYCTGTFGSATECSTTKTGNLLKIVRNSVLNSYRNMQFDNKYFVGSTSSPEASNDWSDSTLMFYLNGGYYLTTGYDIDNNALHTSYSITNNIVYDHNDKPISSVIDSYLTSSLPVALSSYTGFYDYGDGFEQESTDVYSNIRSDYLPRIATVKWSLYGTDSQSNTPSAWYDIERNINNAGSIFSNSELPENRPAYWYGKIGLMYPSDYGYATNGGTTYNRTACLSYQTEGWNSGSYKTDCALNDWLLFEGVTSASPGNLGQTQYTISPFLEYGSTVNVVSSTGKINNVLASTSTSYVRPVLYLKPDTTYRGGSGTWDDPYRIDGPTSYWFDGSEVNYTFPNYGGTLQSDLNNITKYAYIGQDSSKYYVCAKDSSGKSLCLSQPYTQYGLSDHTIGNIFTSDQSEFAKMVLFRVFSDAGFSIDYSNDCSSYEQFVACDNDDVQCEISILGYISCQGGWSSSTTYGQCWINSDGSAHCGD